MSTDINDIKPQLADEDIPFQSHISGDTEKFHDSFLSDIPLVRPDPSDYSPLNSLTEEQLCVFLAMCEGSNIFLTGEGGSGKSYLINVFVDYCEANGISIIKCAPTGMAAVNIGGTTIHKAFLAPTHILIEDPVDIPVIIKKTDIVLIDEISMVRIDLFDYISKIIIHINNSRLKEGKRPIQLIVVGDFFQLPPVIKDEDRRLLQQYYGKELYGGYAFQSEFWSVFQFQYCELKKSIRQKESNLITALNKARKGDYSCIEWFNDNTSDSPIKNAPWLFARNQQVEEYNLQCLDSLPGNIRYYDAYIRGNFKKEDTTAESRLILKKGCRVILLWNDSEGKYVNGSLGIINSLGMNNITVLLDSGQEAKITRRTWESFEYELTEDNNKTKLHEKCVGSFTQFPLKLAYSLTIHKSQGQTFEKLNISPSVFAAGQLYVGLSRATNADQLYIDGTIRSDYMLTDEQVRLFYEDPEGYIWK